MLRADVRAYGSSLGPINVVYKFYEFLPRQEKDGGRRRRRSASETVSDAGPTEACKFNKD